MAHLRRSPVALHIQACLTCAFVCVMQVFMDLDFSLIEMNPFALDKDGRPFPLDMRGELDDTAAFKSGKKWGDLDFPLPFGRSMTSSEEYVHEMDGKTGASLKLSILNPKVSQLKQAALSGLVIGCNSASPPSETKRSGDTITCHYFCPCSHCCQSVPPFCCVSVPKTPYSLPPRTWSRLEYMPWAGYELGGTGNRRSLQSGIFDSSPPQ